MIKNIEEPSLLIPDITYNDAITLMHHYNQDAIIYKGPQTKNKISIVYNNGKIEPLGTFKPKKGQGYSTIKGKHFTFY